LETGDGRWDGNERGEVEDGKREIVVEYKTKKVTDALYTEQEAS
jgi:hypothetical protein